MATCVNELISLFCISNVGVPTKCVYLSLFKVSPLKHGNPVSSINATKATISSWYGLERNVINKYSKYIPDATIFKENINDGGLY